MCKDQLLSLLAIPISLVVIKRFALTRCYGFGIGQESSSLHFCLHQNFTDLSLVESEEDKNSSLHSSMF